MRVYIVRFYDRRRHECKFVVTAVSRRAAIKQFQRRNGRRSLSIINVTEV